MKRLIAGIVMVVGMVFVLAGASSIIFISATLAHIILDYNLQWLSWICGAVFFVFALIGIGATISWFVSIATDIECGK